jgi:SmpA / OmlA family
VAPKRVLLIGGLVCVCVCFGFVGFMLLPASPGITKTNFDKIQNGMTRTEVNELFGTPSFMADVSDNKGVWTGLDGGCSVRFDTNGRVSDKSWRDEPRSIRQKFDDFVREWPGMPRPPFTYSKEEF